MKVLVKSILLFVIICIAITICSGIKYVLALIGITGYTAEFLALSIYCVVWARLS